MKLAIVGGRDFDDYEKMCSIFAFWFGQIPTSFTIVSGGAKGADALARKLAQQYGYDYLEFPADWEKHGKSAGFLRNKDIVEAADVVLAFWDGTSKGTANTIEWARKMKKTTVVVYY